MGAGAAMPIADAWKPNRRAYLADRGRRDAQCRARHPGARRGGVSHL